LEEKKMKKTLIIILALVLVLAFAAGCGNTSEGSANDANGAGVEADDESLRGSGSSMLAAAAEKAGSLTLDEINIFDADDEASFKGGESWANKDMQSVSAE
jgi:predicted small secreted protein